MSECLVTQCIERLTFLSSIVPMNTFNINEIKKTNLLILELNKLKKEADNIKL